MPGTRSTTSPIPPALFGEVVDEPRGVGLRRRGAGHRREAVRPRPRDRAIALNATVHEVFAEPRRSSGSTTTWARSRSRTSSTSASPTRSSSRSGTATTSRACRSPWPRPSASPTAARSTTQVGAIRDVVQNHLLQVVSLLAMEPPSGAHARGDPRRAVQGARLDPPAHAGRRRARPVPGLSRRRRASRRTPPSRRSRRCGCTSTRGAGPACRSTSGPASACR